MELDDLAKRLLPFSQAHYNDKDISVSNKFAVKRADPPPMKKDPSMMTPAELKRARKLERRAQRRAQAEEQGEQS